MIGAVNYNAKTGDTIAIKGVNWSVTDTYPGAVYVMRKLGEPASCGGNFEVRRFEYAELKKLKATFGALEETKAPRCSATVLKRDTYRVSRKPGSRRFSLHYKKQQCGRQATKDGRCYQHQGGAK